MTKTFKKLFGGSIQKGTLMCSVLIICLLVATGCRQFDELFGGGTINPIPITPPINPPTDPNDPENPEISLINTKWKLIGIMENENLTELEPMEYEHSGDCYTLIFDNDTTLIGKGVINMLAGKYDIYYTTNTINVLIWNATDAANLFDEMLYIEYLNNVYSFSLQENKLKLFLYNKSYLQFKPIEE